MGKERVVTQTTPEETPTERQLRKLEIRRIKAVQPGLIKAQREGLSLINKLLTGSTELPGFFGDVGRGISEDITSEIVRQSLEDITPMFQKSGILDSGVAASIASRTAGDIRRAVAEYNLGNKLNLLNLALSGQAQVQAPLLQQSAQLGQRLATLRPVTTTTTGMNPFMRSFQTSLGQSLGRFSFTRGPFTIGGG